MTGTTNDTKQRLAFRDVAVVTPLAS